MSDIPFVDTAQDTVNDVKQKGKTLVPWLPDPFKCPECNRYCDSTRVYDPQRAAFHPGGLAPAWTCPECNQDFVRGSE
jgi:transcription elongation factor Elf1